MRMTLAAARKVISHLTPAQKRKLGEELLAQGAPILRPNPTMQDIRRRGEEIRSGKVKPLTWAESQARLDKLMTKIRRNQNRRSAQ